ncbi:MAG: transposase [Tyzzerella sp.]|nr:transposase [Tyzzerella sp.]
MNSITELLNLEDTDIIISDISIQGTTKTLTLETRPSAHFCPACGFKMHSRGIKQRVIKHPVLQDTYELFLVLKQRRWKCTNKECNYSLSESFKFVNKHRRVTNATDMLIVLAFRNLMETSASIANRFHVSDSYVHEVFDRYVKMDRLPLTDAICIDEVYLDMDTHCKYALVIQDFHTGDPIDLLRSRRVDVTEPYFVSIPTEERNAVKYLISDMYNQYISYVDKYFPNAVPVVDSFHVIQWIIRLIDNYIRQLLKKFRKRDKEKEEQLSIEFQKPVSLPPSDEVYLLKKYKWLILRNQSNITYHTEPRRDSHFRCLMNTFDYEDALFRIDPNLRSFRELKKPIRQYGRLHPPYCLTLITIYIITQFKSFVQCRLETEEVNQVISISIAVSTHMFVWTITKYIIAPHVVIPVLISLCFCRLLEPFVLVRSVPNHKV